MKEDDIRSPINLDGFGFDQASAELFIGLIITEANLGDYAKEAKLIADLGCGYGRSTAGLRKHFPNATIHSVDSEYESSDFSQVELAAIGANHEHFKMNLHQYLQRLIATDNKLDAVLIKSAPDHQLEKQHGYQLLASALREGGVVIEIADTGLSEVHMLQFFYLQNYGDDRFAMKLWVKKFEQPTALPFE